MKPKTKEQMNVFYFVGFDGLYVGRSQIELAQYIYLFCISVYLILK